MATQLQYDVFRGSYEEENDRYKELGARAKFYFTIQSLYLGSLYLKLSPADVSVHFNLPVYGYWTIVLLLLTGLLFTLYATAIRAYEAPYDPLPMVHAMIENPAQKDEDFLDDRIIDLAVATDRNFKTNESVARALMFASGLLFVTIGLHFVLLLLVHN